MEMEYKFICDLWQYMKKHRKYSQAAWNEGNQLLIKYKDIPYAVNMVKAYLDTI